MSFLAVMLAARFAVADGGMVARNGPHPQEAAAKIETTDRSIVNNPDTDETDTADSSAGSTTAATREDMTHPYHQGKGDCN